MDYHAIHGHDVSSFDLPSTHRLPTVSAAQALQDLDDGGRALLPTGLAALDIALRPELISPGEGGIQRGHVTEIWGPPGVGKTAFGIQLAANCLRAGEQVAWVDGFHRVSIQRMRQVAGRSSTELQGSETTPNQQLSGLRHFTCPSLPHLIALLCRPTSTCLAEGTSLVVVDSLSALVNHAFPKVPDGRPAVTDAKGNKGPSQGARRQQVLHFLVTSLQKLAATKNVAVVVLTQCATKMQAERGAALVPAINASSWDQGVTTRLVLFRDWPPDGTGGRGLRYVGIQKVNGKAAAFAVESVCAFDIEHDGLVEANVDSTNAPSCDAQPVTSARKRKLGDTNLEIADSEDEDYGWDDDEEAPPPQSQWQGSEDLLLARHSDSDEEDYEQEDLDEAESSDEEPPAT